MQRSLIGHSASTSRRQLLLTTSFMLIAGATLCSSSAIAADATRDALIQKVEIDSMKNTAFTPDSPLLDSMLAPAKAANPNVSATTWAAVQTDTATSITAVLFGPDSGVNAAMGQSLNELSNTELQHLDALLTDPVLIKFQRAMASPATQRAMLQGMSASALKMQAALNAVLTRHGLKLPSP